MKQIFVEGKESTNIKPLTETRRYLTFRNLDNTMKYRYDKATGEVQDGTYHKVIAGMKFEL